MELNEKCGVIGVYGHENDASRLAYYGLWTLQHRGQENSGIACSNKKRILCHKGPGLVAHVYKESDIKKLSGQIAIGHNRYSTFGKSEIDHSQPVFHNSIALVHNGNLPQVLKLKKFLIQNGIATSGLNDSEMMQKAIEFWYVKGKSLQESVKLSFPLFTGAFSLLVMSKTELVAVRDSHGIRPLSIGKINGTYLFSSETCTFDALGGSFIRDVEPGEMVWIDKDGLHSQIIEKGVLNIDVFEFIYFARPDSILLGKSIYEVRKNLGIELAKETHLEADLIIPVPDTGIPSAIGYSQYSKIPMEQTLIKNRYIHRTFIRPAQKQRQSGVNMKLNLISESVKGKRVAIIDDSIVRGTTSKRLADMIRACNPKSIHMLITSPPVKYPDFYGIDTPNQSDLIASRMNFKELTEYIGVDSLHYLSFDGMVKAIGVIPENLCTSCFTGIYPIDIGKKKIQKA